MCECDLLEAANRFLARATSLRKDRYIQQAYPKLERRVAAVFRRQGRELVKRLGAARDSWPVAEAYGFQPTWPEWESIWDELAGLSSQWLDTVIAGYVRFALQAGGESVYDDLMIQAAFDVANPRAVQYIQRVGAERISGVQQTTKDQVRGIIRNGLQDGWSYDRMARSLLAQFDEFAVGKPQAHIDSRAHLIAVTEIGEAYEEGSLQVAQELRDASLEMEHSWLSSRDSKVSAGCKENDAAGWIPIDTAFPSGHMRPLRFPGCRCVALYRRRRR